MTKALDSAWIAVATFVPKLIGFIVILIIGLLIAKVVEKVIAKVVERGEVKKVLATSSMDASDIVGKLIYYTLVLFVLQLAFGVFEPSPISPAAHRPDPDRSRWPMRRSVPSPGPGAPGAQRGAVEQILNPARFEGLPSGGKLVRERVEGVEGVAFDPAAAVRTR